MAKGDESYSFKCALLCLLRILIHVNRNIMQTYYPAHGVQMQAAIKPVSYACVTIQ